MSIEEHPNINASGLVAGIYSTIEEHLRGDALGYKKEILGSDELSDTIVNVSALIEYKIESVLEQKYKPEGTMLHPHRPYYNK